MGFKGKCRELGVHPRMRQPVLSIVKMTPTGEWTSVWKKNMHQPWVGFTLPFLICEIGYGALRVRTTTPGHNNPLEHTLSLFQL